MRERLPKKKAWIGITRLRGGLGNQNYASEEREHGCHEMTRRVKNLQTTWQRPR